MNQFGSGNKRNYYGKGDVSSIGCIEIAVFPRVLALYSVPT